MAQVILHSRKWWIYAQVAARWRPDCTVPLLAVDLDRGWLLSADAGVILVPGWLQDFLGAVMPGRDACCVCFTQVA